MRDEPEVMDYATKMPQGFGKGGHILWYYAKQKNREEEAGETLGKIAGRTKNRWRKKLEAM